MPRLLRSAVVLVKKATTEVTVITDGKDQRNGRKTMVKAFELGDFSER